MPAYELPIVGGRKVLVRPCEVAERPQLQVAILSTRGNIMEAFTLEASDVLGFSRGLGRVARVANARFARAQEAEKTAAARRYTAALARNPWLRKEAKENVSYET